ncbi:hypothetical protein Mal64_08350 [Pseudobythopirellula maris]|uniref:DNA ligase (ATP) n=1 Tax=Pseudobythopirellula maris TaxID=2527991 RepID=A0A5C5ZT97_9BACT|nr:hypothetical protein [Pseudobythopirellula maris]TWT90446.1 hypothetical protein Mal64_08350 [Pseudobythopirellula maris]
MPAPTLEEPSTPREVPLAEVAEVSLNCEKCGVGFPNAQCSICPSCGWYSVLGMHVEVETAPTDDDGAPVAVQQTTSHLEVWMNLIPLWGWALIATTIAVIGTSIGVRYYTTVMSPDESLRTLWAVSQLIGCLVLAFSCHIGCFILSSITDSESGLLDVVIKPLRHWSKSAQLLPKRLILFNGLNLALTGVIGATLIIGGIPYERLLDWNIEAPTKSNLLGAIAEKAQELPDSKKGFEESMEDFASKAGAGELGGDAEGKPVPAKPRVKADCLIIGYRLDPQGGLRNVLLASEVKGKLQYVGQVVPKLNGEETASLLEGFASAKAFQPFVSTAAEAEWLKPRFLCRVSFTEANDNGVFVDLRWEQSLSQISLP